LLVSTNNADVGRRLLAFGLSVAVQLAAVSAPLVHVHPDDHDTDHHRARAVHAHFEGHSGSSIPIGRAILEETDHDRAVFLQVFVSTASSSFALTAAVPTFVELDPPAEAPAHRSVNVVHGHDPPVSASLPARAPPLLPVLI
jgi:hypothetical protein